MNKKIIVSLGSAVLLASTLFAANATCNNSGSNQNAPQQQKSKKMMKPSRHGKSSFMGAIMQLNLSQEQRQEIRSVMKENMKNRINPNDAFSADGFDKALFIKLSKQKRESQLENQANMIESVYKLLNDSQKQELKKILDQKPMMKSSAKKQMR